MSGGETVPKEDALAKVRHPEVWVNLENKTDKLVIIGNVAHAMRRAAIPESEVDEFREDAHRNSTNLEELIQVCERWIRVTHST